MELSCECGNESDYIEETVTSWTVDGEGNREEKVDEQTRYFCVPCNQDAEVCDEQQSGMSGDTPPDPQHGCELEPKPLAQYLDEYIEHEVDLGNIESADMYAYNSWRDLFQQALDAYESTENVLITIIKKKRT